MSGANRATHEPSPTSGLGPKGECHGYEEWRPALAVFYQNDGSFQRAENVRRGTPLDNIDKRSIDALRAAFKEIAA